MRALHSDFTGPSVSEFPAAMDHRFLIKGAWPVPASKTDAKNLSGRFEIIPEETGEGFQLDYTLSPASLSKSLRKGRHLYRISGNGSCITLTISDGTASFTGRSGEPVGRGLVEGNVSLSFDLDSFPDLRKARVRKLFSVILMSEVLFSDDEGEDRWSVRFSGTNHFMIQGNSFGSEVNALLILVSMALMLSVSIAYVSS